MSVGAFCARISAEYTENVYSGTLAGGFFEFLLKRKLLELEIKGEV
jgi:hypothetical protein